MGAHAYLAPSFAPVWGHCSAAPAAAVQVPQYDTPETVAGTAAHWALAECLLGWRDGGYVPRCEDWVGKKDPDGTVVTEEMAEAAQVMVDDVLQVCQKHGGLQRLLIEQRVHPREFHPEHNWGTLDCALYLPEKNLLFVWDFKYGHLDVDAEGNLQLANYLKGLAEELGLDGLQQQSLRTVVRIVHPRAYHSLSGPISESYGVLVDWRPYWNQLAVKAGEAFSNPSYTPGLHCRFCPAVGRCPAARRAAYSVLSYVERGLPLDSMDGADLAYERLILEAGVTIVKSRLEAVEADLTERVKRGDTDTGLSLQAAPGRLNWTAPVPQVIAIGSMFGADISKPATLTPTQARKAVKPELREAFDQATASLTQRQAGTLKLVPAEKTKAAMAFKPKKEQ